MIADRVALALPPGLAPGLYSLRVALRTANGTPVLLAIDGEDGASRYVLGSVEIVARDGGVTTDAGVADGAHDAGADDIGMSDADASSSASMRGVISSTCHCRTGTASVQPPIALALVALAWARRSRRR